jgi:Amidohydrolase family/WD40-like Beta Propeller Repeat
VTRKRRVLLAVLLLPVCGTGAAESWLTEGTNIAADAHPADGRIAVDLLGNIWIAPARGGDLQQLTFLRSAASRPRWSPDGERILFTASSAGGTAIWQVDVQSGEQRRISPAGSNEQQADWHPSGERIVFVAASDDSGLDIRERDLTSGLDYRLSSHPGDESDPAWSADGRHLCYVLHENDRWFLVVRRFGQDPAVVIESATALSAPSWRPDNTLITYLKQDGAGRLSVNMVILSAPPLERELLAGEDFFRSAPSWLDRTRFIYTADGKIKSRRFESRSSEVVPFTAATQTPAAQHADVGPAPALPPVETKGRIVVRVPRLYDGHGVSYQHDVDIVIEDGLVSAVESRRDRGDTVVFDIGDVTAMPGLIDVYAALPAEQPEALGPLLLAFGVTTLVSPDASASLPAAWRSADWPGPRLLRAADATAAPDSDKSIRLVTAFARDERAELHAAAGWRRRGVPLLADSWSIALAADADLLLGTASMPQSPRGLRYADLRQLGNGRQLWLVSASADAATPGLQALRKLPPSALLPTGVGAERRFASPPDLSHGDTAIVVGSRPSGLPPGLATQAELLALQAAGLPPYQALHAATGGAAGGLGLEASLGRIAPGARADLILVAGDPLANVAAAAEVVAVIKDGRFHSAASLLEQYARRYVE